MTFSQKHKHLIKNCILSVLFLASIGLIFTGSPISQSLSYHAFADDRALWRVPNFLNVASNLPFLIIGVIGVREASRLGDGWVKRAWTTAFIGVTLVSAGSASYHWCPENGSLMWDRLPMTISFMGLFVAVLGVYFGEKLARALWFPAILIGAGSVIFWHVTDDLRFYLWVQFAPIFCMALLFALYPNRVSNIRHLIIALGWYACAKIFEYFDVAMFEMLGETVSGHTAKHLFAAMACYSLVVFLKKSHTPL